MIPVSRLRHSNSFLLNCDLIQRIEEHIDTTVIFMSDGTEYVVSTTADEIVERIVHFRAQVVAVAGILQGNDYVATGAKTATYDAGGTSHDPPAELPGPAGPRHDESAHTAPAPPMPSPPMPSPPMPSPPGSVPAAPAPPISAPDHRASADTDGSDTLLTEEIQS